MNMKQIERILLVVSPHVVNDEAVARASSVAQLHGAKVTVLAAIDRVPSLWPGAEIDVNQMIVDAHKAKLAATVEALTRQGVLAESRARIGVSVVEIALEVIESQADVVVLMADGPESEGTSFAGLSLRLMRKCPCPVWATKPRERAPYRRVIAAVDPTDDRPGMDPNLDEKILSWAGDIARTDRAELVVLHAWPTIDLNPFVNISPKKVQRLVVESEKRHSESLQGLLGSLDLSGVDIKPSLIQGHPSEVIPKTVEAQRADLLVMGTVARTGIRGFVMGNTAEKVIAGVECSVLTLKPDDFVSPVQTDDRIVVQSVPN